MRILQHLIVPLLIGIFTVNSLVGCITPKSEINILDHVNHIPPNASLEELEAKLGDILIRIGSVPRRDIGMVRESIIKLRGQPHIVQASINHYNSLQKGTYSERRLVLAVMGELQRMDTFAFLKKVIWVPLPDTPPVPDGLSPKDNEVILQMKAVEGVGFIRKEDGTHSNQAMNELVTIMHDHPSKPVRITAIDTYMWNHDDSFEAASTLYQILPSDLHQYVERPRFYRGTNTKTFNKRLLEWKNKWEQKK